jgi:UDP:flavonoid glycosyltransferase YjiC (YdhE family)
MKHCTLIHATGVSPNFIKKNESSNMKLIAHLVSLEKVRQEADLIICHAGNGTTCATLLGGRPLLLLPTQLEQYLFSLNIVNYGAGLVVDPESQNHDYLDLINRLLTHPSFTERAQAFAKKYEDFDQPKQLESIVNRCEEIIRQG